MDPAAEATILNADVRPYRNVAAAASDEDGRGVGHGRGYKAAQFHGQAKTTIPTLTTGRPASRSPRHLVFEINHIGAEFLHEGGVNSVIRSSFAPFPTTSCNVVEPQEIAMTEVTRRAALAGVAATALMPLSMTPARAAAPQATKQAPSFYRYNVGTHQITVVSDGISMTPRADNYVVNASKDEVSKVFAENYLPPDKATHSYNPIVINTGSKLIVVDTGLGPATFEQSKGGLGQFQTNLAAAGIDRNNVDTVIISHFHGDHINGLLAADNKAAYPNAEIMVPSTEWKFWMDDDEMTKGMGNLILESNFKNARRVFDALGRKVTQYDAGKEIAPGITSVASPGHTPGHTSYIVASGSDKLLVQVDITAGSAFLFVKNPDWQPVFDVDKPLAVQTRRKLYDMAIAEKMPIQAFHAGFPGQMRVEKDGNGYRWIPAVWNASL